MYEKTIDQLKNSVKHYETIAKTFEVEKKMLIEAASLTQSQMESTENDEEAEKLLVSLAYYNERIEEIDDEYFLACADYWMAQSDLNDYVKENGNK